MARSEPPKVIATVVDGACGHASREDTDGNIYLPISMGYCNCYYRSIESLGFKVAVDPNGTLTAEGAEGTEDTFVALLTYYLKRNTDHPCLKVSQPAEDICYYCYTFAFANKHTILSNHTNTTADGESEIEEIVVSDANDIKDGNILDVEILVKLLNNTTLHKPELANIKVEEAKELLILKCSKHTDMKRAQRFLYQSLEAAVVCDDKNDIEYLKRKSTLTVDFGQNIQVPCYNSEQPDCTYYYTPMTTNNFGMVNQSHDGRLLQW